MLVFVRMKSWNPDSALFLVSLFLVKPDASIHISRSASVRVEVHNPVTVAIIACWFANHIGAGGPEDLALTYGPHWFREKVRSAMDPAMAETAMPDVRIELIMSKYG